MNILHISGQGRVRILDNAPIIKYYQKRKENNGSKGENVINSINRTAEIRQRYIYFNPSY